VTAAPLVRIEGLSRRFGNAAAVDDVSLDIEEGEFFALLGPSGCGKTTLLRMIAGLENPSAGRILIDGIDMADVPANRRPVNMVFQSYAVFPHRSVARNVGYGLEIAGIPRAEREARIAEAIALVRLDGLEARMPDQLSGGQRQRVALARALVMRPRLLLLDEPLAALDAKLREAMRSELAAIQRQVGVTFVMVTHDQDEALSLATRCALMDAGRLVQIGSPADLYERPASRFAAGFIGSVNLFEARVEKDGVVACPSLGGLVPCEHPDALTTGTAVWLAIRPEKVSITHGGTGFSGIVRRMVYQGSTTFYEVAMASGAEMRVSRHDDGSREPVAPGTAVCLNWNPRAVRVLTS
jgi:spermidine/putrescine transport system ATP-binding protein